MYILYYIGYELYDLVVLSENECAVVIAVGAEKLRVINHMDIVKEVCVCVVGCMCIYVYEGWCMKCICVVYIVCMCILYITKPHAHTLHLCATHILYYNTYVPLLHMFIYLIYYTFILLYVCRSTLRRSRLSGTSRAKNQQASTVSRTQLV